MYTTVLECTHHGNRLINILRIFKTHHRYLPGYAKPLSLRIKMNSPRGVEITIRSRMTSYLPRGRRNILNLAPVLYRTYSCSTCCIIRCTCTSTRVLRSTRVPLSRERYFCTAVRNEAGGPRPGTAVPARCRVTKSSPGFSRTVVL
jgi:hypothetical protein